MEATWIVAANSARARFFAMSSLTATPQEIFDMVSPSAREPEHEIVTDNAGELAASKSRHNVGQPTVPSGYQPHRTPAQHEADLFARDVANYLQNAHNQHRFGKLFLMASPEFLGILRKQVEGRLNSVKIREVNKDYTGATPAELKERVREHALPDK